MKLSKNYLVALSIIYILSSCGTSKKNLNTAKPIYNNNSKVIEKEYVYINKNTDSNAKYSKINEYNISLENFPAKAQNERVRFLILHYTVIDYPTSLRVLTQKDVSSHYLVTDQDDTQIDLLVSEDKRSWHAGVSKWENFTNLNDTSIGIEIVNKGMETIGGKNYFFDFPEHQIRKVAILCQDIIKRYNIKPEYVLGHSDIAPLRKQDPGAKFPWKMLYEQYNIGAWYNEEDKEQFMNSLSDDFNSNSNQIKNIQTAFSKYGYSLDIDGIIGDKFKTVIATFQQHFRPENYDGILDRETYAILLALNKKYKSK